nr:DUF4334 domain-containing protein [Jongsikchunia kroppenstedtii]
MSAAPHDLAALESGTTPDAAAALFDSLPPVAVDEVAGRWHGGEVPTGHPMDGLLTMSGWYGKQFDDADHVHPLLFGTPPKLFAVNPRLAPMGLLARQGGRLPRFDPGPLRGGLRAARTRHHRARLRMIEHRGKTSAAMVYDDLPIIDHFRKVDNDTLLGVMDLRGMTEPYFFTLRRD